MSKPLRALLVVVFGAAFVASLWGALKQVLTLAVGENVAGLLSDAKWFPEKGGKRFVIVVEENDNGKCERLTHELETTERRFEMMAAIKRSLAGDPTLRLQVPLSCINVPMRTCVTEEDRDPQVPAYVFLAVLTGLMMPFTVWWLRLPQ